MNDITKKSILGGKEHLEGEDRDYSPENTLKVLKEYDLLPTQDIEIENPITHKKSIITINREGTHEEKLITALANPNMTRDQKDGILSMYLFERGKENASFMAELFRYKGTHTKETRAFISQMRFDFEMFIGMQVQQMRAIAKDIYAAVMNEGTIQEYANNCVKYLKDNQGKTVNDFLDIDLPDITLATYKGLLIIAIRNWTEAQAFEEKMNKITESREKGMGKGIYLDLEGKPYSIYQDEEVDEIVKKDINRINELNNE